MLVPFAMSTYALQLGDTGFFAATVALAGGIASVLWGRIATRDGEVALLRRAAMFVCFAPSAALVLSITAGTFDFSEALVIALIAALFATDSAAFAGNNVGSSAFILSEPSTEERPLYLAMVYTLNAPLQLAPVILGGVAAFAGYPAAFGFALVMGLGSTVAALLLRGKTA